MSGVFRFLAVSAITWIAGCKSLHSNESMLSPTGPQAARMANLFWLFFGVSLFVWASVAIFLILPLWRRRIRQAEPLLDPPMPRERRIGIVVTGSVALTILILFVLLVGEFATARATHKFAGDPNAVSIKITAQQWWWEVQYKDALPSNIFTTANEIHIPIGKLVAFELESQDVIHSFWVPNLHGKKDIIPGHAATLWLRADKPGQYWANAASSAG